MHWRKKCSASSGESRGTLPDSIQIATVQTAPRDLTSFSSQLILIHVLQRSFHWYYRTAKNVTCDVLRISSYHWSCMQHQKATNATWAALLLETPNLESRGTAITSAWTQTPTITSPTPVEFAPCWSSALALKMWASTVSQQRTLWADPNVPPCSVSEVRGNSCTTGFHCEWGILHLA